MRIVSMVPSWTETFIEAGIEVVGRTRFCIHPKDKVKLITALGGTKDISIEKLRDLNTDYIILDREENTKTMADDISRSVADVKLHSTHVKKASDVVTELRKLASLLQNEKLAAYAARWDSVIEKLSKRRGNELVQLQRLSPAELKRFGIQQWIKRPEQPYEQIVYVIWKNPYMAVTAETFVGSMLELVGLKTVLVEQDYGRSYPEIDLDKFDKQKTLFLFSSEPFPFHKKISDLEDLALPSAIVDGESYSWFGVRALLFLEDQFK